MDQAKGNYYFQSLAAFVNERANDNWLGKYPAFQIPSSFKVKLEFFTLKRSRPWETNKRSLILPSTIMEILVDADKDRLSYNFISTMDFQLFG